MAMSPRDWLTLLGQRLLDRRYTIDRWQHYYDGRQDLPAGPQQHKDAYMRFQKLARTNLCKLSVDSMIHRMQVIGYRAGDDRDQVDNDIWRIWQLARLDSRQFGLYRRALIGGSGYAIVGVNPRRESEPLVTVESARNVIVAVDPADPTQRLAALRMWHDEYRGKWFATLYLPGARHGFMTAGEKRVEADDPGWAPTSWESRFESVPSFDRVPVIEFSNSDEGTEPKAEFAPAMDVQNRLNLTLINRLTAERYAAFRQRYLLNYEVDYDEVTGLPIPPFNPGADQTFVIPPPAPGQPEPRFGDLVQTDTSQMLRAVEADMRAFAAITITPVYYLPGDLINISAEGIAALDAGHIAKIRERALSWSEAWEEVLQLAAEIVGIDRDLSAAEVVWRRPENFDIASMADYAVKSRQAEFPVTWIAEKLGESPQEVERLRTELAADAFRTAMAEARAEPQPTRQPEPTR